LAPAERLFFFKESVVMTKNILIVTGDGGESYEALYAIHRLREAGYKPVVAAPSRRPLNLVQHDFEPGWDTYIERPGYRVTADLALAEAVVDDYDAILILGGRAPEYLRHDRRAVELVRRFDAAGKWVFGICHGIQLLIAAGLARGRRLTCYENIRCEVEIAGGAWDHGQAVRDGRVVTAQTWQSHPEFYREVLACLAEGAPR
jgi:protease I